MPDFGRKLIHLQNRFKRHFRKTTVTHQVCMSAPPGTALYGSHDCIDFTLYDVDILIHEPATPKIEKLN